MSTGPREFEHPIDECNHLTPNELPTVLGVGSIPAEAVEAAARAIDDIPYSHRYKSWREMLHDYATAALTAAAPFIAAQAKAEALREAAKLVDDPSPDEMDFYQIDQAQVGNWLRARAATIESEA